MNIQAIASLSKRKKTADFQNVLSRFWKWVDKTESGCWLWTGCLYLGYGRFRIGGRNGKTIPAHRFAYENEKGEIPTGLQLDHLCRVRNCVNPNHLEPVTQRENILRGESPSAQQARQKECIRGHYLSGENLYLTPLGKRNCKICRSESMKRFYDRKKNGK